MIGSGTCVQACTSECEHASIHGSHTCVLPHWWTDVHGCGVGGSSLGDALDHGFRAQVSAQGRTQMSEAAVRLTARSKGADGAHSRLASRGRSAGPRPCLRPSRLPCPDSTFFWQLRLIRCTLSKDGGQGWGSPGGAWGRGWGPAQCISAACWWASGGEERTLRVLSGLCIRFDAGYFSSAHASPLVSCL